MTASKPTRLRDSRESRIRALTAACGADVRAHRQRPHARRSTRLARASRGPSETPRVAAHGVGSTSRRRHAGHACYRAGRWPYRLIEFPGKDRARLEIVARLRLDVWRGETEVNESLFPNGLWIATRRKGPSLDRVRGRCRETFPNRPHFEFRGLQLIVR